MRVLQCNLQRSRTADALLDQLAREHGVDALLVSEQYRDRDSPFWFPDSLGTAGFWARNTAEAPVRSHGCGRGFVWVRCRDVTFFSCYLTPNEAIRDFRDKIDRLEERVLDTTGHIVVGGDFNARAVEWGMPSTNSRGKYILDFAARAGLVVLNEGDTPTFRRPGQRGTIPDITLASESLLDRISDWRVLEDYGASDHQYIAFDVLDENRQRQTASREVPRRWNTNRLDVVKFTEVISRGALVDPAIHGEAGTEALVTSTMELIVSACDRSMPRRKPRRGKQPVYWWTPEIAELRKTCLRARRAATRARIPADRVRKTEAYKAAKKTLRRAINRSKADSWRRLRDDVDSDPWGLGYKIVTQRFSARSPPSIMEGTTMERIVTSLFPTHPLRPLVDFGRVEDIPLFSNEELESAVLSLKSNKAPGPDGIPSEALKKVFHIDPRILLNMYNACLTEGVFPSPWKTARLVLISKGKGDPDVPSSYRPLCMLDTAGKLFEKLIRARLNSAVEAAGDLSPRQYGFRKGRSTIDAIGEVQQAVSRAESHNHYSRRVVLLVTLDVKNAFNSARWVDMLEALRNTFRIPAYLLRLIENYLRQRLLIYETREGTRTMDVTSGAAQGSILGPDLWNVAYDSLLRSEMPEETVLVGYADDVAALIAARNVEMAQLKLNQVMRVVNNWMANHGLSLALSKTEIVILTKKRIDTVVPLRVGDVVIQSTRAAKYLGVMVDNKLTWRDQIFRTADKASKMVAQLSRLMANVGGPKSSRRRLMMSAVQSVLLYGAEVWADALNIEFYRIRIARVQRQAALRVCSAYRTVSEPAVLVIAGVIPVKLLAGERKAIYQRQGEIGKDAARAEERSRTYQQWQQSWERETRGRWTARLIKQVQPWVERRHGEVDYYLTMFLSGHGYFRSYLHRMGKADSPDCIYCPGVPDDAEHTFFRCSRWERLRLEATCTFGAISVDTVCVKMLEGEEFWSCWSRFTQGILRAKKIDLDRDAVLDP